MSRASHIRFDGAGKRHNPTEAELTRIQKYLEFEQADGYNIITTKIFSKATLLAQQVVLQTRSHNIKTTCNNSCVQLDDQSYGLVEGFIYSH